MPRASNKPGIRQELSYSRFRNRATARITAAPSTTRHSPSAAKELVGAHAGQSAMPVIPMPTGKAARISKTTKRTTSACFTTVTLTGAAPCAGQLALPAR